MEPRRLTAGHLNRALLDRQLLLRRADLTPEAALERTAGLQTQYAPSGYVGLWSRVAGFQRADLTRALEDRRIIQATLQRTTIRMVSRRDFWPVALGVRTARREWAARTTALPDETDLRRRAESLRVALADGPRTARELGGAAAGFLGTLSLWVDLVRVPPSGTWERRRADRLALATDWVGPEIGSEEAGIAFLVRAYLGAYGPAPWRDIATWAGIGIEAIRRAGAELALDRYRDDTGADLVDLEGAVIPDPDTPAPVRFVAHWDDILLVHARRTGVLPEAHRPRVFSTRNPFSVGVVLVDGRGVAAWSIRDGRVVIEPFEELRPSARDAVEAERAALEAFHA